MKSTMLINHFAATESSCSPTHVILDLCSLSTVAMLANTLTFLILKQIEGAVLTTISLGKFLSIGNKK